MRDYLVGTDIGTSGCKTTIFDAEMNVESFARDAYTVSAPAPGRVELDPNAIWASVCRSVEEALSKLPRPSSGDRFTMSFSVLGDGLILTDMRGELLYPGILSSDTRSASYTNALEESIGDCRLARITGRKAHPMTVLPKIMWAKDNLLPSLHHEEDVLYEDFQSWIFARLGMGSVTDYSVASGSLLFDINSKEWSDELLTYAGLDREALPQVVEAGTFLGFLDPPVTNELGFPAGRKVGVAMGGFDQMCNALGSGTVEAGDCTCSSGTVECLTIVLPPGANIDGLIALGLYQAPSLITGQFVTHVLSWNGGGSLRWFCDNFAKQEQQECSQERLSIYEAVLKPTPPANDIFFLPHLSGSGTPWMDPRSRGAIIGLTLAADVPSVATAIIEGVTFELKENITRLEAAGVAMRDMKVVGGGSKSDKWMQVRADIFDTTVHRLSFGEAGSLGAAILARKAMDPATSVADIAKRVAKVKQSFCPSDMRDEYARKYDVYRKIYPALRNVNEAITSLGQRNSNGV